MCVCNNAKLLMVKSLSIAVAASIIPVRPELRNDDHSVVDSNATHGENFGKSCFSFGTSSFPKSGISTWGTSRTVIKL